jgi:hypothetical protein
MDAALKRTVRDRAGNRCEYCGLTQAQSPLFALQIEHIVPRKHHGASVLENLALACIDCNLHKGPNLTGIDPETGSVVELFHPRRDRWNDHFRQAGAIIVGLTATGRATIDVLNMNSADQLTLRSLTLDE